jgi:hypothetical protein
MTEWSYDGKSWCATLLPTAKFMRIAGDYGQPDIVFKVERMVKSEIMGTSIVICGCRVYMEGTKDDVAYSTERLGRLIESTQLIRKDLANDRPL